MLVGVVIGFFFFQAEDGIRDAQESRGLGDVYKRQGYVRGGHPVPMMTDTWNQFHGTPAYEKYPGYAEPVSYTHLTLPTIYSV